MFQGKIVGFFGGRCSGGGMRLSRLQPLQLDTVAPDLREVVLNLLHKPAFLGAAEDLRQPHGHFRRYAALFVHQFG